MNTRQKLTLGIAAIFMVTLTIVGVTYAYFVTRVNTTGTETKAVIKTADISVTYNDGNGVVSLQDVEPGTVAYKTFKVTNSSTVASYDVKLTSFYQADKPKFVHTFTAERTSVLNTTDDATLISNCYTSAALTTTGTISENATANCYTGTGYYDNMRITLKQVTKDVAEANSTLFQKTGSTTTTITDENYATLIVGARTITNGTAGEESQLAPYYAQDAKPADTKTNYTTLASGENIDAQAVNYYVLKVEYANNGVNQNIENDAAVSFRVDIDA